MIRLKAHQREEMYIPLGMRIFLTNQASNTALNIEVTDEQDPLFLYQMVCTE
jgi:hypothetical protein